MEKIFKQTKEIMEKYHYLLSYIHIDFNQDYTISGVQIVYYIDLGYDDDRRAYYDKYSDEYFSNFIQEIEKRRK